MNVDANIELDVEPLIVARMCRACYTYGKVTVVDGKWMCPNCKGVKAYQVRYGKGPHMKGRRPSHDPI
ncbi:MAG: hypothetical protein ABI612_06640 [Betaproteobacteria bacterium]